MPQVVSRHWRLSLLWLSVIVLTALYASQPKRPLAVQLRRLLILVLNHRSMVGELVSLQLDEGSYIPMAMRVTHNEDILPFHMLELEAF